MTIDKWLAWKRQTEEGRDRCRGVRPEATARDVVLTERQWREQKKRRANR